MSTTTNDDVIADLKQFVAATVSQHTTEVRKDIAELSARINAIEVRLYSVDKKIDDLSSFVAEAVNTLSEDSETKYKNHEKRITRLESSAASSLK